MQDKEAQPMPPSFARHTVSFIVRLWAEPGEEQGQPCWRGQIEPVGSNRSSEKVHFQVPAALLEFLTASVVPVSSIRGNIELKEEQ